MVQPKGRNESKIFLALEKGRNWRTVALYSSCSTSRSRQREPSSSGSRRARDPCTAARPPAMEFALVESESFSPSCPTLIMVWNPNALSSHWLFLESSFFSILTDALRLRLVFRSPGRSQRCRLATWGSSPSTFWYPRRGRGGWPTSTSPPCCPAPATTPSALTPSATSHSLLKVGCSILVVPLCFSYLLFDVLFQLCCLRSFC